jgi:PAS domain S-box-containing protein
MPERSNEYFINFLSEVPFFSEVGQNSLKLLFREIKEENFLSNEVIFKKNDIGNSMYIIVEGKVKVHEKNHVYSFLSQGDCFGEYALIDSEKRSASITTTEKTKVLRIDRQCFIELMATDNGFAKGILSVMINRHREKNIIQEKLAASINDLELANSKLSGLINGALDSIIMIDSEFKIILTNPSADVLLENDDSLKRNVLFFFDDDSADLIQSLIQTQEGKFSNKHIPGIIKVIGSNGTESHNEGTISMFGNQEEVFYTLILRNIDGRLENEERISILTNQTRYLKEEIKDLTNDFGIIAEDKNMIQVLNLVDQVAPTKATVLIAGETGTGKELIARAIHSTSDRLNNPLIRVNCGAIPENLIESELFGHEKGAFTGASSSRKGRFAMADKGTIFLDEIGELPLQLQPKRSM